MTASEDECRPWGSFIVIDEGVDYKVKRIIVQPNRRLSYQVHSRRSEHWLIVSGQGAVTLDGVRAAVGPGSAVDVGVGVAHRIDNFSTTELIFIEVQRGSYFGEDDIMRIEDDFGRVDASLARS